MRQALEFDSLPHRRIPRIGWLGRLRARFFVSGDSAQLVALRHCSAHFLRDIGLSECPEANRLLQDHHLRR